MFGSKRSYRRHDDSFDEYDVSDHNFTESEEFVEEELTEESDDNEEVHYSESIGDMGSVSMSVSSSTETKGTDSSSHAQLEDVEQDEENVIDEVLDMKIIPYEDSWKYPPSLLVRPEPEDVWKFDDLRPKNKNQVPRSDGGLILERMKFLEEDIDMNAEEQQPDKAEQLPKDQQKVYIFQIKWKNFSHIHATWELEANLAHLNSYVKIKKYKHMFIDRQTILASEKVSQQQKDQVLEQIEEIKLQQQEYLIPEKIIAFKQEDTKETMWNASLQKVLQIAKQKQYIDSDAFDGSFVKGFGDGMLHYYNCETISEVDNEGFVKNSVGVDKFKGALYLIKWQDLSY